MTKNNRNLFIGAFVIIGAGAYMVYKFATKAKPNIIDTTDVVKDEVKDEVKTTTNSVKDTIKKITNVVVKPKLGVASYPLKKGSKGSNVVTLQNWLNKNGYAEPNLIPDGDFGAKTETAVRNMQMNPNTKAISDYIQGKSFSVNTSDPIFGNVWNANNFDYGQISIDFFSKFIM